MRCFTGAEMDDCGAGYEPASTDDSATRKLNRKTGSRNHCQVDGCITRLKRAYCRRFRGSVLLQGQLSRFCQRCGRFHGLDAFDGSKRNCRAGLAHHNSSRRARRQQKQAANTNSHNGKTSSNPTSSSHTSSGSSGADSMQDSDDEDDANVANLQRRQQQQQQQQHKEGTDAAGSSTAQHIGGIQQLRPAVAAAAEPCSPFLAAGMAAASGMLERRAPVAAAHSRAKPGDSYTATQPAWFNHRAAVAASNTAASSPAALLAAMQRQHSSAHSSTAQAGGSSSRWGSSSAAAAGQATTTAHDWQLQQCLLAQQPSHQQQLLLLLQQQQAQQAQPLSVSSPCNVTGTHAAVPPAAAAAAGVAFGQHPTMQQPGEQPALLVQHSWQASTQQQQQLWNRHMCQGQAQEQQAQLQQHSSWPGAAGGGPRTDTNDGLMHSYRQQVGHWLQQRSAPQQQQQQVPSLQLPLLLPRGIVEAAVAADGCSAAAMTTPGSQTYSPTPGSFTPSRVADASAAPSDGGSDIWSSGYAGIACTASMVPPSAANATAPSPNAGMLGATAGNSAHAAAAAAAAAAAGAGGVDSFNLAAEMEQLLQDME